MQYFPNWVGLKGKGGLILIRDEMIIHENFWGKNLGLEKSPHKEMSQVHVGICRIEMELE